MLLLDRVTLDFVKTFRRPAVLLNVEPKMARKDKDDPKSEQVQASDEEGNLKWVVTIAVPVQAYDREKFVNLPITVSSKTQPLASVPPGSPVVPEDLEMGTLRMDKGGFTQFFSASAIRPVTAQQPSRQ